MSSSPVFRLSCSQWHWRPRIPGSTKCGGILEGQKMAKEDWCLLKIAKRNKKISFFLFYVRHSFGDQPTMFSKITISFLKLPYIPSWVLGSWICLAKCCFLLAHTKPKLSFKIKSTVKVNPNIPLNYLRTN